MRVKARHFVTRAVASATLLALAGLGGACSSSSEPARLVVDPGPCSGEAFEGSPLSIRCGQLVDAEGREVWLHGVNARVDGVFDVSFDDGRTALEPIPAFEAVDASNMRGMGFDALRLPVNWSGLEPTESGGFSEAYLDRVAAAVAKARDAGLYVLVDLHQDAYSKEIGEDGAPYWAISPAPPEKLQGPLNDLDERRLSRPVSEAFATFFGPSDEGVRLRGRFAKAAAHLAARFADDPAVIGFELYNEPLASAEQLFTFHRDVLAEVRKSAPKKLVFFEPSAERNLTDRAPLPTSTLGPGTVYAPHVYTLAFTGTPASIAAMTRDTLRPSNQNAREEADAWQAPLVIGEMGFSPASERFADYIGFQLDLEDEVRASSFFWLWKEDSQGAWGIYDKSASGPSPWTERPKVIEALTRIRLERVAGRLGKVAYDSPRKSLSFTFEGNSSSSRSVVSTGRLAGTVIATCDGRTVAAEGTGPLQIPCGGPGGHEVTVTVTAR